MRFRPLLPAFLIAFAGAFAPAGIAQDKPAEQDKPIVQEKPAAAPGKPAAQDKPPVQVQADPRVKEAARGLIEEVLKITHAADIFTDLRRSLREVYIPALRDFVMGDTPGIPAPDPKSAAAAAKALTFLDYARKAGDELDVALSENRKAMISDVAEQMAKTAKAPDIESVRDALKLPAVTKGLNALYAISKLLTGFSYEDSRTFTAFSAWASHQDFDLPAGFPGIPQLAPGMQSGGEAVPPREKVVKAQALMSDLLVISHIDEMVEDAHRFMRDVYVETAPMSPREREALRQEVEQFEFVYYLQKAIALAAAPSVLAATFSDEQLSVVHRFVRSPAFAKFSNLLRDAVKASTAFTKEDILEARKTFEDLEKKARGEKHNAAEEKRIEAEWEALADKWTEILKKRISPETREGLERSLDGLKEEGLPI
jgi:hypothetical protein